VTETLNTGNQWRFITCLLNSPDAIVDLVASTNYELCELKITEISEDDKEFRQLLAEIKDPIAFRKPIIVDPNSEPLFISLRTNDDRFMELWKHGQAGIYDNQGKIKPTHWYGKQHEFNFEFVVSE